MGYFKSFFIFFLYKFDFILYMYTPCDLILDVWCCGNGGLVPLLFPCHVAEEATFSPMFGILLASNILKLIKNGNFVD